MADKPSNAISSQQINDAQHLDDMTSLQQPSEVEQSLITQHGVYPNQSGPYCMDVDQLKSRTQKGWL
ncbi:hypothetical protein ICN42_06200 [Polynucleobacter sp. 71A-WALBACH]|uniref:hypothetical protein n=1 Tax=Polynucleobacter sp. 71A-WALBACH TaxID=2689097 RepID=UPI001C0BD0EB|nr:hypothetical protein [Polynucleobacter sp. 71A-WALBACH]MBU3593686.1 hypothetical protein [Polynucleobacter sp. 71A-WALBACH]